MARLAVLSYHTSPLAQPGTGDGGGMNVYVRELSSALARLGHEVDVYTRRDTPASRDTVLVEPGFRVHHVTAGPPAPLERDDLAAHVDDFTDAVATSFRCTGVPDAIHANYWLSGLAGHRLKHELDVPLVMTFHTLERVKAETFEPESDERARQEAAIFACADAVLASCDVEAEQFVRLYHAEPSRVHVVPLGVEHAFFAPGHRPQARRALGVDPAATMLLFVGRLQALKGVDVARRRGRRATLAIVGGPSGPDGRATLARLHERVAASGTIDHVTFVAPQAHQLLSTWMRAADATLVPSRSESFGPVALESSACGTRGATPGARPASAWPRSPRRWRCRASCAADVSAPLRDERAARLLDEVVNEWARQWRASGLVGEIEHRDEPDDLGHVHWLVRVASEEKDHVAIWLTLRQRTVRVETELCPAPEENLADLFRYLLVKNADLAPLHLAIGPEAGIYLVGQVPVGEVDVERFDELVGACLKTVDELYPTAMSIGLPAWYRRRRREGSGSV